MGPKHKLAVQPAINRKIEGSIPSGPIRVLLSPVLDVRVAPRARDVPPIMQSRGAYDRF
jgi:hypothetical protein